MTCLSDIDLATLHKCRLEERLNYKLAWGAATTNRLTAAYYPHYQLQQYQHHQLALHQNNHQKQQQQQAQKSTAHSRNAAAQNKQQKSKQQQQQQKQVDKDKQQQHQQQTSAINKSVGTSTNTLSHSRLQHQSHDGGKGKFATDDLLNGNCIEFSNKMQHLNLNFDDDALSDHQKVQHKSRKSCAEEGRRRLLEDGPNCNYFTATKRRQRSGTWP
ncbi:unnamed protein product [Ceratitis capitata]|uniref:(Mediterranean fruit fly) hypothetical protein n=1 Tax=Ceratitis capitata TaxID=7213 RepID=A0A811VE81_CERCA|nr:unnamed protein product [Ceratitis capitata]